MVLVSHQHRFIFIKTGKTAGTSVEMALEPACASPGHRVHEKVETLISAEGIIGSRMHGGAPGRGGWSNHKPAKAIERDLGPSLFSSYRKITTVRNPFDKCVSAFHWSNRKLFGLVEGFAEVRTAFQHFITSRAWPDDVPAAFIDGRYIIDTAIRFEHLAEDLGTVANDLGLPFSPVLPHTKSTAASRRARPVADYYDPASINIVRDRLSWVFERFSYPDHPQFAQDSLS